MPNGEQDELLKETQMSLERMQSFDVHDLPREKDLGTLSFREAVEPARKLVDMYRRVSPTMLEDLPVPQLTATRNQANGDYKLFEQVLNFTVEQANPLEARNGLIQHIWAAYQTAFTQLHPWASYSMSKSTDFKALENEARATIQTVLDKGEELVKRLEAQKEEGEQMLKDIREVAAEHGVTQQAVYFRDTSNEHEKKAKQWLTATVIVACVLGLYAILSMFLHKIAYLAPTDTYQSIQLSVSKVLIFAVITYMLYLSARNFLAHKHNSIVNKHRQNALMTFRALVDAAQSKENTDVILTRAAGCIYDPQATGYARDSGPAAPSAKSVVELLTKPLSPGNG